MRILRNFPPPKREVPSPSDALAEWASWPSLCRVPLPSGKSRHFTAFSAQSLRRRHI